jgi:hypothetical protein
MSCRVRQKIKGKIYIYEATSFWVPETKKAKQKRKYIGVENEDGKITIPHKEIKIKSITEYGAIYLLNYLSEECKLSAEPVLHRLISNNLKSLLRYVS